MSKKRFFATLAAVRLVRFGGEGLLARVYGQRILVWLESPTIQIIITLCIVIAILGSAYSAVALFRARKRRRQ